MDELQVFTTMRFLQDKERRQNKEDEWNIETVSSLFRKKTAKMMFYLLLWGCVLCFAFCFWPKL